MKAVVIIPTYNEGRNIKSLVKEILTLYPGIQILIIDDNSPDGTGVLADSLSKEQEGVYVIHRPKKLGLGSAYKEGFDWAIKKSFDYILQMDADFSHRPIDIFGILKEAESGADLVIGSRYKDGLRVKGWSIFRIYLSYFANLYVRIILGVKIYDMTSGFRCFRADTLRKIDLSLIRSEGYAFQIEMVYLYCQKGFIIKESPIVFIERKSGKSKFNIKIIIEAFLVVLKLRFFKSG